ncbi:putative RNA-binding Zn ribbon-like protein [Kitasatospora sp. MAA4]|uniref:CGNR zinc finger domain-containing protein n=1 Tax=Kitasatospora sp. MAA4 TaxID=3035093 RepID=UPI00247408B3|nr:CGNR zinc finger domain-containing protein [Kitasatospora sp. MAA4]MDH6131359.1 putative RNA-binding Zn ribbon-like protein [Kitasatospora sp. MAA4]
MDRHLALELATTIRHDGHGGVADDLATVQGLADWLRAQSDLLDPSLGTGDFAADEAARAEVVAVRAAVRSLFARAVSPEPPSPADADRLLSTEDALRALNAAAARQSVTPQLDWPVGADPRKSLRSGEPDPVVRLTAALARAAIDFLTGPQRELLRACTAPRCVRYFVKGHGRQEYCKPSCSNRARVARHYQRAKPTAQKPTA